MKSIKFLLAFTLAMVVLLAPTGAVFAAPALKDGSISGMVTEFTCETDIITGIKTFLVTVKDTDGSSQTVRINQSTAEKLRLVKVNADGNVDCSEQTLALVIGMEVEIDPSTVLPNQEDAQNPVGAALATFFSSITDYDTIMKAHDGGFDFGTIGFGVIAQALWITEKLISNSDAMSNPQDVFLAVLEAKASGDYSGFVFDNGLKVENWGQFRRAVLDGVKKGNLGIVMPNKDKDKNNQGNGDLNGNGQGNNNSNGNNGNGHGNGNDNGNKDKNKGNGK